MLSIPRVAARRYWAAFRQLLTGVPRRTWPAVRLLADRQGLRIVTHTDQVGLELHVPGAQSPANLNVSCDLLQAAADGRGDDVTVEAGAAGDVLVKWRDGDVPRQASFTLPRPAAPVDTSPPSPTTWADQPPEFLSALQNLMQVTDPDSLRYALNCVQLDGDTGAMTATDGSQILSHRGWHFGFAGSALVPANKVLTNRDLAAANTVRIGKTDSHFVVQAGDWTTWLALNREGRFPNVADLLATDDAPATRLVLAPDDRRFLQENLPRLPARRDDLGAVTVDLNGHVAIRARDDDSSPPTELVLNRSTRVGAEVRFCTDRRFLAHALELGFADVAIQNADQPVVCRDHRRTYLWALLTPDHAIGPTADAVVIASTGGVPATYFALPSSIPEKSKTMITNRIPPTPDASPETPAANGTAEPASIDALIDSAEQVKVALRDAVSQVSDLIVALRRHRRQSKTLQSALSSIRALQALDA